jgi:hypothetical protein
MDKRVWVRAYRGGFAVLTIVAMGYQLYHLQDVIENYNYLNFFSFFTIESNIFAALVLLYAAWKGTDDQSPRFELIRGAAVLYMATTGVVYGVLLSGYREEVQTSVIWVDNVVHKIFPLVVVADWFIVRPRIRIEFRQAAWWLVYPMIYCAYSLIRGSIVDWYPYPFLNPDHAGGYAAVALYCVAIAIGISLFGAIVVCVSWRSVPADQVAAKVQTISSSI